MANLRQIKLGAFPAGEIPPPLLHQFLRYDKTPIDITGWTVLGFYVDGPEGQTVGLSDPTIYNGPNGQVTYSFVEGDMALAGTYKGLIWIQNLATNPTLRLASDLYIWDVKDGPGPTPPDGA